MIEFDDIYVLVSNAHDVHGVARVTGDVLFSVCNSCGVVVADKDLHIKHHQTPVIG